MRQFKIITRLAGLILIILFSTDAFAQKEVKLGAYYFDGWTGKTYHITTKLTNSFPEREPVWGWITSTPTIVEKQIDAAKEVGLDFFSFCWYYNPNTLGKDVGNDPKNNALALFQKAPNKAKLDFTLMVANHEGYIIKAEEWGALCNYWVALFKDPAYLKVNQRPLITFFDFWGLINTFGTSKKVNDAFEVLRNTAIKEGLKGVSIAACVDSSKTSSEYAAKCGFDIVTGYNYANYGLASSTLDEISIDSMRTNEQRIWSGIGKYWKKPIIPVVTVNWDKRPWVSDNVRSPRFKGFSNQSVAKAVTACREWMSKNKANLVAENLAILYAWNEYGEGAYLTPSKNEDNKLEGVKKALLFQIPASTGP